MKIIDLFSGVGGLSLGFEKLGFKNIVSLDNWQDAIDTYNHNRKDKNGLTEDVRIFKGEQLSSLISEHDIVGVLGGPPCQGFSSARLSDTTEKNLKTNLDRNNLVFDFIDIIRKVKPSFFVMENVRGVLNIQKGNFLKQIIILFNELGYNVNYELINTSEYQIPQIRKRLFIVGFKTNFFHFPIKYENKISTYDAIGDLPFYTSAKYINAPKTNYQKEMRNDYNVLHNHLITEHSEQTTEIISQVPDGGNIKSLPESFWNIRKFNKAFQRMNSKFPSLTVDTGHRNYFHYKLNRIPTVRENARLQSFPDNFEFIGSKTSQYKQVGNAVPPKFALELARSIMKHLN